MLVLDESPNTGYRETPTRTAALRIGEYADSMCNRVSAHRKGYAQWPWQAPQRPVCWAANGYAHFVSVFCAQNMV